jgi:hypothetical protein
MSTKLDAYLAEVDLRERILEYANLETQYLESILQRAREEGDYRLNQGELVHLNEQVRVNTSLRERMDELDVQSEQLEQFDVGTQVELLKGPIGKAKAHLLTKNLDLWLKNGDGVLEEKEEPDGEKTIYFDAPSSEDVDDVYSLKNVIQTLFPYFADEAKWNILHFVFGPWIFYAREWRMREAERRPFFSFFMSNEWPGSMRLPELLDALVDADEEAVRDYFFEIIPAMGMCPAMTRMKRVINQIDMELAPPNRVITTGADIERFELADSVYVTMLMELRKRLRKIAEKAELVRADVHVPRLSSRRKEIWEHDSDSKFVDVDGPIGSGSGDSSATGLPLAFTIRKQAKRNKRPADDDEELDDQPDLKKPATDLKEPATALLLRFNGDVEAAAQMLARLLV